MGAAHRTGFGKQRLGVASLERRSGRPDGFGRRCPRGGQRQVFGPAGPSPTSGRGNPRPTTDTTRLPGGSTASAGLSVRTLPLRCFGAGARLPYLQRWRARGGRRRAVLGGWTSVRPDDSPRPNPRGCLQPGEPHGRQQGATDLRLVCGATRRSRAKRQGRNARRIGSPEPNAHNEVETCPRERSRGRECLVRQAPRRAGSAVSREWTHTQHVDGGAKQRRTP